MDKLKTIEQVERYIYQLLPQKGKNNDEVTLLNNINYSKCCHASQAIRKMDTHEVRYYHLTLRMDQQAVQSPFKLNLSPSFLCSFDLLSLYIAIKELQVYEKYKFDLPNIKRVVPIRLETLAWPNCKYLLSQLRMFHGKYLAQIIPSVQITKENFSEISFQFNINSLKNHFEEIWYELDYQYSPLDVLYIQLPDLVKFILQPNQEIDENLQHAFLKRLQKHNLPFVVGRIDSSKTLNEFKLKGSSFYFGFIKDYPACNHLDPFHRLYS